MSTPRHERSSNTQHLFYQDIYDIENNVSVLVVIWSDMRLFHCPNVSLCRYLCLWTVSSREYRPLVDTSVGGLLVPESIVLPVVIALVLTFIIEIYSSQNNVIIYKTCLKYDTLVDFGYPVYVL